MSDYHSADSQAVFQPNEFGTFVDDFPTAVGSTVGVLPWAYQRWVAVDGTSNHPGIIESQGGIGTNWLTFNNGSNFMLLGNGLITMNWVFDLVALSTVTNRYTCILGFSDKGDGSLPANGVYFSYSDNVNSGKWVMNCVAGGVLTSTNTTITAATGYKNFQIIVNQAASSVSFSIDGVGAGSVSTNIPTLAVSPAFSMIQSAGNLPASHIDLFYMSYSLTVKR